MIRSATETQTVLQHFGRPHAKDFFNVGGGGGGGGSLLLFLKEGGRDRVGGMFITMRNLSCTCSGREGDVTRVSDNV